MNSNIVRRVGKWLECSSSEEESDEEGEVDEDGFDADDELDDEESSDDEDEELDSGEESDGMGSEWRRRSEQPGIIALAMRLMIRANGVCPDCQ